MPWAVNGLSRRPVRHCLHVARRHTQAATLGCSIHNMAMLSAAGPARASSKTLVFTQGNTPTRAHTQTLVANKHTHTCYHAHRPARKPRPSACSEGLRHSTDATCFAPITTHQARLIQCRVMLLGSASLMARGGIACCATPQLDNIAYTRIPCQPRHCCHNFALLEHLTPHSMHRLPR